MRHFCIWSLAIFVFGLLATPAASQGSDDICMSMIVPLIVQSGLDAEASAPTLGCRQDDRGEWFMPTVSDIADPSVELSSQSLELLDAVDRMSVDAAFGSSLKFNRQDAEALVPGAGGADSVDVSDYNLGAVPSWMHNLEDNYMQSMQTYLTRTAGQEVELVLYMQWFMARRDTTLSVITQQMNPMSGPAFLSNWGYQHFPWPWQLADPTAIAAYTGETLTGSEIANSQPPAPTPIPSPTPAAPQEESGGPNFSPAQLTVLPGDTVDVSVSLPTITFGGAFMLTVTLPPGLSLVNIPQCTPTTACERANLETNITQSPDGSTAMEISGFLMDRDNPATFSFALNVSEEVSPESSLLIRAGVGFSSRSAPPGVAGESVLEISVESPDALPRAPTLEVE